ncbi:MAG: Excisionase/Xis, DNA-binding protein [Candidatus Magnetoglobus multicellularis str. Araruama]|uniref:Excisionase/Xis, DNA-binding protein n=1 Tax=Candidatus Magnetoglobus multicellularis str. Araruama TaxID=890399 RepID=A0A1V1P1S7_9BACT|nr:MAG: Excisionase/Xis, DNA-binding protein [Candidatus Magnetoglobus multicellularis str. Araruama]
MYDTISKLLKNPFYAGVYGYGKRKIIHEYKDGALIKKRGKILPYDQWQVFIKNNHECYVSWEEFLEIQKKISNNNPHWDKNESLGAIRDGLALFFRASSVWTLRQ